MATFMDCGGEYSSIMYNGSTITNDPVNIDLCTSMTKGRLKYYPDNIGLPTIKFNGCASKWVFNDEAVRDAHMALIIHQSKV